MSDITTLQKMRLVICRTITEISLRTIPSLVLGGTASLSEIEFGDFTSQEYRNRLPQPSFQASLQWGHHRQRDQPEIIIQGMCGPLLISNPCFCKADKIMLIARKSLNALQGHESLLNSLNRLCWRLSRLAQADMHAVLFVRRRP